MLISALTGPNSGNPAVSPDSRIVALNVETKEDMIIFNKDYDIMADEIKEKLSGN